MALAALFAASFCGQIFVGLAAFNQDLREHGRATVGLSSYLQSGHFLEATFENWESEFLQMGIFVLLTVRLFQRGSSESKKLSGKNDCDEEPSRHRRDRKAPWPVRSGGWALKLYAHSLSIAFFALFAISFALHAVGGLQNTNEERALAGLPPQKLADYFRSPQFWYESLQNWQSEFLAVLAIVVLSIFLREKGSPQSKPVAAPHYETGD
jgi:hypothetical protein